MAGELLITTSFDNSYIINDGNEKELKVCVGVQPSKELREYIQKQASQRQGVDLYLIIDNSRSMLELVDRTGVVQTGKIDIVEGQKRVAVTGGICKLDVAKEAAKRILDSAREVDTINLVVYNEKASVVFKKLSIRNKKEIFDLVDNLKATGETTNFLSALNETALLVSSNQEKNIKKAILLTDGVPNIGSEANIFTAALNLANKGVSLDCLGIGKYINFSFLEKLSTYGGGRTEIVKKGEDASRVFADLFQKSKDVVITNAVLKLNNVSKLVRITEHYQGTPENRYLGKVKLDSNREIQLNIGQLEKNQIYNFYFKVVVSEQGDFSGMFRIMTASVEYSVPSIHGDNRIVASKNVVVDVGYNPKMFRMNGEVTTGYLLAEVKRYEMEAEEYRKNREHQYVISSYEKIIDIYENLRNVDLAQAYKDILNEYKSTGNINLQRLNETMNSSSKAGDDGLIEEDLRDDEAPQIRTCGRNRG